MAEYITKEQALMQLTGKFPEDMSLEKYISLVNTRMNKLSPVDVIERSKINKAIEEIEALDKYEMERFSEDAMYHRALKKFLEIFKRNIGE